MTLDERQPSVRSALTLRVFCGRSGRITKSVACLLHSPSDAKRDLLLPALMVGAWASLSLIGARLDSNRFHSPFRSRMLPLERTAALEIALL